MSVFNSIHISHGKLGIQRTQCLYMYARVCVCWCKRVFVYISAFVCFCVREGEGTNRKGEREGERIRDRIYVAFSPVNVCVFINMCICMSMYICVSE